MPCMIVCEIFRGFAKLGRDMVITQRGGTTEVRSWLQFGGKSEARETFCSGLYPWPTHMIGSYGRTHPPICSNQSYITKCITMIITVISHQSRATLRTTLTTADAEIAGKPNAHSLAHKRSRGTHLNHLVPLQTHPPASPSASL